MILGNYIHPRKVASKSSKTALKKSIAMALEYESDAVRHNVQNFNNKRYIATADISDYESLKDKARAIKENAIDNLPHLIDTLTKSIEKRGGNVFFAKTKDEANNYIKEVCKKHDAKLVVKAKSITSEEIQLNPVLEEAGIEVAETDLAEFILQVSKEQPSHIVAPAIHRSRESISELFKQNFKTDEALETGEDLTRFARDILREKFLSADVGISGANMLAAESGTILLVESEGNIRLSTQIPAVHIAISGIEKIVPSMDEIAVFVELLAASATGQNLTSYTNILNPPLESAPLNLNGKDEIEREFHLVLIDNGRMKMREDVELKEALYCIRCSACLNSCANFQAVGGHAFGGESYSGGIGASWAVGTSGSLQEGRFAELCTGCSRCIPNCPVRIDIPWLNTVIKDRLLKSTGTGRLQKMFFGNFAHLGKFMSLAPGLSNWIGDLKLSRTILEKMVGFEKQRKMPVIPSKTLLQQFKQLPEIENAELSNTPGFNDSVILFSDIYTNYSNPGCGISVVKVFNHLGIKISISKVIAEGRDAQSQGLSALSSKRAVKVANYLEKLIGAGNKIVVSEPSVLALFRRDYKRLINNNTLFEKIRENCYDPVEYLSKIFSQNKIAPNKYFNKEKIEAEKLFYHEHCQMKTIDIGYSASNFFTEIGFEVIISSVECCGMAGSFGYKKEYYDLSKRVADDLIAQINASDIKGMQQIVLASGTSCREQINYGSNYIIYHPVEFLTILLK